MAICWVCQCDMTSPSTVSRSAKRRSELVPLISEAVTYCPMPYDGAKDVIGGPWAALPRLRCARRRHPPLRLRHGALPSL
jgi:hypothetical protein